MGAPADVEQWTLLALAIVIIFFRIYVRWVLVGPRNFAPDDYLMPVAGVSWSLGRHTGRWIMEADSL